MRRIAEGPRHRFWVGRARPTGQPDSTAEGLIELQSRNHGHGAGEGDHRDGHFPGPDHPGRDDADGQAAQARGRFQPAARLKGQEAEAMAGMEAKSKEFLDQGGALYVPAAE